MKRVVLKEKYLTDKITIYDCVITLCDYLMAVGENGSKDDVLMEVLRNKVNFFQLKYNCEQELEKLYISQNSQ